MNKLLLNLVLCMMLAIFAGCRHVPMVSRVEDASSKQFRPPAQNMAGIYIYRESGWAGKTQVKPVWLDGQLLGGLTNGTYFTLEVAPGAHTLSIQEMPGPNDLHFTVSAGKNYFFSQELSHKVPVVGAVVSPFVSVASFGMVDAEEGQAGVLKCQQAVLQAAPLSAAALATSQPDCVSALETDPELQVIGKKVALSGKEGNLDTLTALEERPTPNERKVIQKWAAKRERCFKANPPPRDSYYQLSVDSFSLGQKLIGELAKGGMTYGQFAVRRKQIKDDSLTKARSLQAK